MSEDAHFLPFADLVPRSSPNAWLVAPRDAVDVEPDEPSPVFPAPAARAAQVWVEVVGSYPRTRIIGVSESGLQIEAEQRSAMFGFVDRISAQFIPVEERRSTAALYSRAEVGYWDLGVNRRRLRDWLTELQERLRKGESGDASG